MEILKTDASVEAEDILYDENCDRGNIAKDFGQVFYNSSYKEKIVVTREMCHRGFLFNMKELEHFWETDKVAPICKNSNGVVKKMEEK